MDDSKNDSPPSLVPVPVTAGVRIPSSLAARLLPLVPRVPESFPVMPPIPVETIVQLPVSGNSSDSHPCWQRHCKDYFGVGLSSARMGLREGITWNDVNHAFEKQLLSSSSTSPLTITQVNENKLSLSSPPSSSSSGPTSMLMYFTRHGEGIHNVAEREVNKNIKNSPKLGCAQSTQPRCASNSSITANYGRRKNVSILHCSIPC